ncbi:hypothetical protein B0T26DRAFT_874976 [Lasiosphaeria miniovina]|uniref:Ankyrin repeat protein n=1 Tax=Lasiosphaeria miniovina TaxID=1954250 RepID=A0AA40DQZ6_9PEZI|nr:uncharacterized protein B0T26DRAFT_874976 [Lasiosphaeria miniovina]KAK0710047.1 hypothetical protein B0T26DRAFT_874976 [Lasiosphaeria miniovina]
MCHHQKNYSASMVISTLIHQLLRQYHTLQAFAYETDKLDCLGSNKSSIMKGKHRSASILWHLLFEMIQNSGMNMIYIIIDALNECQEGSANELSQWNTKYPGTFLHMSALDFDNQINGDIKNFVRMEMKRIRRLRGYSGSEVERIEKQLAENESKNFLAVSLIFKQLEKVAPSQLDGVLDGVSNDLGEFYRSLVSKLPAHLRSEPSSLVTRVMYSRRPFTLAELAYAIDGQQRGAGSQKVVADDDISRARSRIEMFFPALKIHQNNTLSFFHYTIRDFILKQASFGRTNFFVSSGKTGHRDLAILCLREIIIRCGMEVAPCYTSPRLQESVVSSHTFLSYAIHFWHMHLREAVPPDTPVDQIYSEAVVSVKDLVELWKDPKTKNYRQLMISCCGLKTLEHRDSDPVPLEILSAIGAEPMLRLYLRKCEEAATIPVVRPYAARVIGVAIKEGNEDVLATLLDAFEISSLDGEEYATALQDSAWSGKPRIVERVRKLRRNRTRQVISALIAAFIQGEQASLDHLAEDGSLFVDRNHFGMTALHALFAYDKTDSNPIGQQNYAKAMGIVRAIASYLLQHGFLVSRGAEPHHQNITGLTPLHLAAYRTRNADAIKCLLELGGSSLISKVSHGVMTPLHWAMTRRSPVMVLHDGWEAEYTYEIIRTLLRAGANPLAVNRWGLTAVEYARMCRYDWQWIFAGLDGVDYISITYSASPQELMWQAWHRVDDVVAVSIAARGPRNHGALESAEGDRQQQQQQLQPIGLVHALEVDAVNLDEISEDEAIQGRVEVQMPPLNMTAAPSEVRVHGFFGSYDAVIRSLAKLRRNRSGLVYGSGVQRDLQTGQYVLGVFSVIFVFRVLQDGGLVSQDNVQLDVQLVMARTEGTPRNIVRNVVAYSEFAGHQYTGSDLFRIFSAAIVDI